MCRIAGKNDRLLYYTLTLFRSAQIFFLLNLIINAGKRGNTTVKKNNEMKIQNQHRRENISAKKQKQKNGKTMKQKTTEITNIKRT